MKITLIKKDDGLCTFESLSIGTVFKYRGDDEIYLKTYGNNRVHLATGGFSGMSTILGGALVCPLKCELRVEGAL